MNITTARDGRLVCLPGFSLKYAHYLSRTGRMPRPMIRQLERLKKVNSQGYLRGSILMLLKHEPVICDKAYLALSPHLSMIERLDVLSWEV
jgi:hypothetical protein